MNAYFVDAGEHEVVAEYVGCWPRHEIERVCGVVFADSPGKAKVLFLRGKPGRPAHERPDYDVEFCELKVRVLGKGLEREAGCAAHDDPLWEKV